MSNFVTMPRVRCGNEPSTLGAKEKLARWAEDEPSTASELARAIASSPHMCWCWWCVARGANLVPRSSKRGADDGAPG